MRASEDEMTEWHHLYNEYEFGQTLGDGEGQGGLVCYSPWGSQRVGHDWVTEQKRTELQRSLKLLTHFFIQYHITQFVNITDLNRRVCSQDDGIR